MNKIETKEQVGPIRCKEHAYIKIHRSLRFFQAFKFIVNKQDSGRDKGSYKGRITQIGLLGNYHPYFKKSELTPSINGIRILDGDVRKDLVYLLMNFRLDFIPVRKVHLRPKDDSMRRPSEVEHPKLGPRAD
ncbi:hypothetical protein AG1IA_01823 [Rhizoctonia solani AG-1 IA]|uniref:Uncharacterized protein n=1 Tax=Thanatephorus cucumeris (strain AG1-IA) TaxID=983506 RepID=L8X1D4_THACA|nr:hypothetical protein AG1IA_01823 [Rhizoctonia solani AG-1 IA]